MRPEAIQSLIGYTYWAFERVWDCIAQLTDDQFTQDLGYSSGSIRNQVIHLISSHQRWVDRLQGKMPAPQLRFADYSSFKETKSKWDEAEIDFLDYVNSLDHALLDEVIPYEISGRGISAKNRRWEILLHLVNHSTDHRAQILALLDQQFNIETHEQDLILYLWEKEGG